jgi:hypothetical protein
VSAVDVEGSSQVQNQIAILCDHINRIMKLLFLFFENLNDYVKRDHITCLK